MVLSSTRDACQRRDARRSRRPRDRRLYLFLFTFAIAGSTWRSYSGLQVRNVSATHNHSELGRRLSEQHAANAVSKPLRILYIVTTLAEYNSGTRSTQRGSDRLQETLIPVLVEGVESMLSFGYHVDVHLVCHWTMLPNRLKLIRQKLPTSVGLDVWDDASPLGYNVERTNNRTEYLTQHLSRQHRFVIKDKFTAYDFFIAFEDDMLIKGDHVKHYLKMTKKLARLRTLAPDNIDIPRHGVTAQDDFYGPLTKAHLSRLVPGLMRVEALLDEDQYGTQSQLAPIPVELEFGGVNRTVDPRPCCHVSNKTVNNHIPAAPSSDKLFIWETGIEGLSVREVSSLGWVMLMGGATALKARPILGDYWSGRDGDFGKLGRPRGAVGKYLSNQGGWMASRQQIWEWHTESCPGGFLPPYYAPHYRLDGIDARNVEWWSGGLGLFTFRHACNLQRIVSLDPDGFSRHLVYHSANNKQTQLAKEGKKERFVKADHLWGQLNTVRKRAEEAKKKETARQQRQ